MDFSTQQAAKLTGLDIEVVKALLRLKIIVPSVPGKGKGSVRRFTFRDLVALRTACYLRNAGVGPKAMKQAIRYLMARSGLSATDVLAGTLLLTDGRDVYEVSDDVAFSTLRMPGQATALTIVPLSRLVHDLQANVQAAERLREAV